LGEELVFICKLKEVGESLELWSFFLEHIFSSCPV